VSRLVADLETLLAREKVTITEFCRTTTFPATTLAAIRRGASPKQATVDRLMQALASWRRGQAAAPAASRRNAPDRSMAIFPDAWAKAAADASDAYVKALGGRSFDDGRPSGEIVDLAAKAPAMSREPCRRCGVRGDIGCAHQLPMADAW
jgi:hypothetical protein